MADFQVGRQSELLLLSGRSDGCALHCVSLPNHLLLIWWGAQCLGICWCHVFFNLEKWEIMLPGCSSSSCSLLFCCPLSLFLFLFLLCFIGRLPTLHFAFACLRLLLLKNIHIPYNSLLLPSCPLSLVSRPFPPFPFPSILKLKFQASRIALPSLFNFNLKTQHFSRRT